MLLLGAPDVSEVLPITSAVPGLVGCVLIGRTTLRAKIFHPLIGWLLVLGGTLNLVGGFVVANALMEMLGVTSTLALAGALAGYG